MTFCTSKSYTSPVPDSSHVIKCLDIQCVTYYNAQVDSVGFVVQSGFLSGMEAFSSREELHGWHPACS